MSSSLSPQQLNASAGSGEVITSPERKDQGGSVGRLQSAERGGHSSARPRSGLRVCMITHSSYETDNRVRRYAETLVRREIVLR